LPKVYFQHDLAEFEKYPKGAEMMDGQRKIFKSRRQPHKGQVSILMKRIAQSDEEINGLRGQIKAEET
jgi:membrane fusion protein, epimerase transport system